MSDKFASTIQTYNRFAPQFIQHFEKKLDTTELDKFLAGVPKGGYILDAGCGSARDSAYFISKGYKALGIDLSEGLLAEAKKIHPEVTTQQMSLTDISLPDAEFDAVWCKAALLHIDRSDIPKVLKSFYRILKSGGALFIQTKEGEGEGTQPVPFDETVTRMFTFFTVEEMEALVKDAGFGLLGSYDFNGKSRGTNSRDQEWVVIFAKK
jgi:ubiquinone/menaquinone biosynthesis C-methylase UbiE